jgi:hypothetical protein
MLAARRQLARYLSVTCRLNALKERHLTGQSQPAPPLPSEAQTDP